MTLLWSTKGPIPGDSFPEGKNAQTKIILKSAVPLGNVLCSKSMRLQVIAKPQRSSLLRSSGKNVKAPKATLDASAAHSDLLS